MIVPGIKVIKEYKYALSEAQLAQDKQIGRFVIK